MGCFIDKNSDRDLSVKLAEGIPVQECFEKAKEEGFKYAGLQSGKECYAGNSFGKHG
jgi:hypothetical protein